eukprot:TRINITY_DN36350_c0_g1_i1.p1 TRINITY_DN36350_c0_g1~~TRINITY_DN36350_c0_g1_i1.p1  ORF type:complete len:770 (+),score=254.03 TRINITY_DN36350_c0_g1_i1:83-2311(+)
MQALGGYCAAAAHCLARPAFRENDSAEQRNLKSLLMPLYFVIGILCLMWPFILYPIDTTLHFGLFVCAVGLWGLGNGLSCVTSLDPTRVAELVLLTCTFGVIMMDWDSAANLNIRNWSFVVLLMDLGLVTNVRQSILRSMVALMLVWLSVERAEAVVQFGLYDLHDFDGERVLDKCTCAKPPCTRTVASSMGGFTIAVTVFLTDFRITQGFSGAMRSQLRLVDASIRVADSITAMLSRYEVENAREELELSGAALPPRLLGSLQTLVANLQSYKAFLPQSCLPTQDQQSEPVSPTEEVPQAVSEGFMTPPQPEHAEQRESLASTAAAPAVAGAEPSVDPGGSTRRDSSAQQPATDSPEAGQLRQPSGRSLRRVSFAPDVLSQEHQLPCTWQNSPTAPQSAPKAGAVRMAPQVKNITLLCRNRTRFLSTANQAAVEQISAWLACETERFASEVQGLRGVVDLLSGDHSFASFGAARRCITHRLAGTKCAFRLLPPTELERQDPELTTGQLMAREALQLLPSTLAVCCGTGLCGDFGSEALRRFMVISGASSALLVADRLAAKWGVQVLCNGSVRSDVQTAWETRLCEAVYYSKYGGQRPVLLWEICGEKPRPPPAQQGGNEWMYEMSPIGASPWEPYNSVMKMWIVSGPEVAAVAALAETVACNAVMRPVFEELARRIRDRRVAIMSVEEAALVLPAPTCGAAGERRASLSPITQPVQGSGSRPTTPSSQAPAVPLPGASTGH